MRRSADAERSQRLALASETPAAVRASMVAGRSGHERGSATASSTATPSSTCRVATASRMAALVFTWNEDDEEEEELEGGAAPAEAAPASSPRMIEGDSTRTV